MFTATHGCLGPKVPAILIALIAGAAQLGCTDACGPGRNYALSKYWGCCEQCGPGAWAGPGCNCPTCGGDSYGCGDACGCGDSCDSCSHPRLSRFWQYVCGGCQGCGELYWNEWYNDPPECCEPCDCMGNYTGPGAITATSMAPALELDPYYSAEAQKGNRSAKQSNARLPKGELVR